MSISSLSFYAWEQVTTGGNFEMYDGDDFRLDLVIGLGRRLLTATLETGETQVLGIKNLISQSYLREDRYAWRGSTEKNLITAPT